jgi:hypothetical protein
MPKNEFKAEAKGNAKLGYINVMTSYMWGSIHKV